MTTTSDLRLETAQVSSPLAGRLNAELLAVVGFDGSDSAQAALEAATELIRGRAGQVEVVYVEHLPVAVSLSAPAAVGVRDAFGQIEHELVDSVRATLVDREPRWNFQRRSGAIAGQLVAAAKELQLRHGPEATILIVVGSSAHLVHHVMGSVPAILAHEATFPMLMIPAPKRVHHADVETAI